MAKQDLPSSAVSFARRARRSARSWARTRFTREQVWSTTKSLAWITPLTILIWVYAEREQVRPPVKQAIPFQIRTSDARQVVTVLRPEGEQTILAELQGPQQAIENVVRNLVPSDAGPGPVIVLPSTLLGQREIPTSLIRESDFFQNSGVLISNESPLTLLVRVDKLVDVELEVRPPEGMDNFITPPKFEPRYVRVTLPQSVKDQAAADNPLTAVAELGRFDAIRTPGAKTLTDVPVSIVGMRDVPSITIDPQRVTAHVNVRNAEREFKISSVPVWALYPPVLQGKYVARISPDFEFIRDVVVTGPEDIIKAIEANNTDLRPKAILDVLPEDINKDVIEREVRFDMPPGVNVQNKQQKVTFRLEPIPVVP
ncbi:MAG TPA: hypothetical protein VGN72_21095 [Tepidisphaeraceae bacterium]|jgi:hypothetical protein|nr:hypothetical protein [Tepidisphaeraceae bacterium]